MNKVFLGLGGNLYEPAEMLEKARKLVELRCGSIQSTSSLYETEAWGMASEHRFLNQVIELHTNLGAEALMDHLLKIENELGRTRNFEGYADRTIDLDVLFFNEEVIQKEKITVPHPRIAFRKFVLVPLCEIASEFVHPITGKTLGQMLEDCNDELEIKILTSD